MSVRDEARERFRAWCNERMDEALLAQLRDFAAYMPLHVMDPEHCPECKRSFDAVALRFDDPVSSAAAGQAVPEAPAEEKPRRTCTICHEPIRDGYCRCVT